MKRVFAFVLCVFGLFIAIGIFVANSSSENSNHRTHTAHTTVVSSNPNQKHNVNKISGSGASNQTSSNATQNNKDKSTNQLANSASNSASEQ